MTPTLPIPGMTVTPVGLKYMGGADFVCCVQVCLTTPECVKWFEAETGIPIASIAKAAGIDAMIDKTTGRQAAAVAGFADWVALNIWGAEK